MPGAGTWAAGIASGDVVVFLDADTRLPDTFLERFVEDFSRRGLDLACPLYAPHDSTPAVERFHGIFNLVTRAFQVISRSPLFPEPAN